ncbi:hypothetical protein BDQ17DRAFT_1352461 [Cyathus striatus]|nr:hypothetical protein BDQ17DRAFT_1352461 [Cyathus striatus]
MYDQPAMTPAGRNTGTAKRECLASFSARHYVAHGTMKRRKEESRMYGMFLQVSRMFC